jgi:hypothetical protein
VRAVLGFERRRARRRGVANGRGAAITAIQRFGSALNTNVHFHTLVAQGVFAERADGSRHFAPAPAPAEDDVARLLATVQRRIVRLVARHGIDLASPEGELEAPDERQLDLPAYAAIQGAAVLGRIATGNRVGHRVRRVGSTGEEKTAPTRAPDGSILLRLRRPWRDGTWAVRFAPNELLEKLAAMIPKPRINLVIYHGAFAPHARDRAQAVRRAHEAAVRAAASEPSCQATTAGRAPGAGSAVAANASVSESAALGRPPPGAFAAGQRGYVRPTYYPWADLLRRTFAIDVLACPECGGRLRLVATIAHPPTIAAILRHLGLPTDIPRPAPAPAPHSDWWA